MFPIGDDQHHKGRFAPVTWLLLAITIVVFLHESSLSPAEFNDFITQRGTTPASIMKGENMITLLTNMFLHGGWAHLLGNMLFLYVFGDNIEKELGSIKFALFYIIGGVLASMTHILLDVGSTIPAIGASGAIAALLGAYIIRFPSAKIKMLIPTYSRVVYWSAKQFLGYWIVVQLVSGFGALGGSGGGIARWAHIGGFVFGAVVAWLSSKKGKGGNVGIPSSKDSLGSRWLGIDKRVK